MKDYKISRYLLSLPLEHRGRPYIVLHHTLTGADCILNQSAWAQIIKKDPELKETSLPATLQTQGFLVAPDTDEYQLFTEWRSDIARNTDIVKDRILTDRGCDNRCTYCSIKPQAARMSPETARRMDRYHMAFIAEKRPLRVKSAYLGGEPFLNYAAIRDTADRRFDFCRKRSIDYSFNITTNGKHLTVERVNELLASGLSDIHVSLAGPADVHNRLRPSADGSHNYEIVLRNLESVSHLVPVHIEYQYDAAAKDYERITEMIGDFNQRGIRIASIEASPIMPRRHDNRFNGGFGDSEILEQINKVLESEGFPIEKRPPYFGCIADQKAYIVYDADGSIIPCPSLQLGEFAYGHVNTGIDYAAETQLLKRRFMDRCRTCALLPKCMGGCRLRVYMEHGDFNGVWCNADHLEHVLLRYMRRNAEKELKKRWEAKEYPFTD